VCRFNQGGVGGAGGGLRHGGEEVMEVRVEGWTILHNVPLRLACRLSPVPELFFCESVDVLTSEASQI